MSVKRFHSGRVCSGAWVVCAVTLAAPALPRAHAAETRPAATTRYCLEWNGATAQTIQGVTGGVRSEPLSLQVGAGLDPAFYEWIDSSWNGRAERARGAVLTCGSTGRCSRKEFTGATLSQVTFPALDAASKDHGYVQVVLRPDAVKPPRESAAPAMKMGPHSIWLACNFRLTIDGLDCSQVRKIDSFTVKQGIKGVAEFPGLGVMMGPKSYESFQSWYEASVVKGSDLEERDGELAFCGTDLQTVLGRIRLIHVRVKDLQYGTPAASKATLSAGRTSIGFATTHLYCQRMELVWGTAGEAK